MTSPSLLEATIPELTCWVNHPDADFQVELKYMSAVDRDRLLKECQIKRYDNTAKQLVYETDEIKFKKKVSDLIVNWKGLTAKKARAFVGLKNEIPDDYEFPCTPENRTYVIERFKMFATWVIDTSLELHTLVQRKEAEEEKN